MDDLTAAEDLTTDLVCYHHDRRAAADGGEVEPWAVLADVEATLRAATPLPHPAPRVEDLDRLRDLVAAAWEARERLIAVHLDRAEQVLTVLTAPGQDRPPDPVRSARGVRWLYHSHPPTLTSNTVSIELEAAVATPITAARARSAIAGAARPVPRPGLARQAAEARRAYAATVLRGLARTQQGQPAAQVRRLLKDALAPLEIRRTPAGWQQLATDVAAGRPVTLP